MYKRTIITFLVLFMYSISNAQDYKTTIEKDFIEYLTLINDHEFEKAMDYVLPRFFELVPKNDMIAMLEQTFNDPLTELDFKLPETITIADAENIDRKHYAILSYTYQANMRFLSGKEESESEKKVRLDGIKTMLEQQFGDGSVHYNETTDFFESQVSKKVCAVSEDGNSDWKFIDINKNQQGLLEQLLPAALID